MKTLVLALLAGLLIQSTPILAGVQDSSLKDTTESKYKVGQMWSYKTRPDEEKSYFIVVKVETHPKLGNIVHIAVRKLKMQNRRSPGGVSEDVNHMPFSEEAINESAVKILKDKVDLPDFRDGYQEWRDAFDAGHAGIYTITLAEAVKVMELNLKINASQNMDRVKCCGGISRSATGLVRLSDEPFAACQVHWTTHQVARHGAEFYLILSE